MQRLNTSQSEGCLSRMSDKRRERLMDLKRREDLKDALSDKFKMRFGHDAPKPPDEVSISSSVIKREVDNFAGRARVSEANLARLERRLQGRALGLPTKLCGEVDDAMSCCSGISGYSAGTQRSRSFASINGMNVIKAAKPTDKKSFDWTKLDEYAAHLHEQDALRQKMGTQALQKKLRQDLAGQLDEKKRRKELEDEEDLRYHQSSMVELERWKQMEREREEERHEKIMREKADRDEQLSYERKLKKEESEQKTQEESLLVTKIVDEMEAEQLRYERKKEKTKKAMREVFNQNIEDQKVKEEQRKESQAREARAMKDYNRILDEQEQQRADELAERVERQNKLMKDLQDNVGNAQKGAKDNDELRSKAQQDEMDRHFWEAETVKQNRLKELKMQNQAYLVKQMQEKDARRDDERHLTNIQAQILAIDTQEYNDVEKQKEEYKRQLAAEHRVEIERQMAWKHAQKPTVMSDNEIAMNKPLLDLVSQTLEAREQAAPPPMPTVAEDEEDE